jgi:hypothetical protein
MQNDESLTKALREARPEYSLPAGFQGAVWRRIRGGKTSPTRAPVYWLEVMADWCLRPSIGLKLAALMVGLGIYAGVIEGAKAAQQQARERYLTAVAPREVR